MKPLLAATLILIALALGVAHSSPAESVADIDTNGAAVSIGPDLIVGDLQSVLRHAEEGGITAYSVATNACNLGDWHAKWISYNNQHPLIFSSMFRLKDDRFEQIGMSWVSHGFYAVAENLCGDPPECYCQVHCDLNDPDRPPECLVYCNGSHLAVGCSNPCSPSLNGVQTNMSPRYLVNAHTGQFPFPWEGWEDGPPDSFIERRLQVHNSDLDPIFNQGTMYFIEGHYILPDDAAAGNSSNNASYRQVYVAEDEGEYLVEINPDWSTQREQPAIRAWQDHDPSVVERDIQVPDEGLFILATKATDIGSAFWRYAYALQNLNSDRSAGSFSVPIFPGTVVANVGFHDVDYHSDEPYDLTDWSVTIEGQSITWSTENWDYNENANALRFGTLYNFYFDANVPPDDTTITLGLFKPGQPNELSAQTVGPTFGPADCNGNGIPDDQDIAGGTSEDNDRNGIPDECQEQLVPAVSEWGLVILALLLLAAGKTLFNVRRRQGQA